MTNDQNDYLKNWIFRANEDIAALKICLNPNLNFLQAPFVIMLNKQLKNFLKLTWFIRI